MKMRRVWVLCCLLMVNTEMTSYADDSSRQLVQMPEKMQQHMLANMREHLQAINGILFHLANNELDAAAQLAEQDLGMSSLESHGAEHMAKFMPEGMRRAGTAMHTAASHFALTAQEGELLPAVKSLAEVTKTCVSCHAVYRIR